MACASLYAVSPSSSMMRSTFSTTTMASSTSSPIGQHQAEHRQRVDGEAERRHHPEGPKQHTGTAIEGMIVARTFCRNRNITRNTSAIPSNSVLDHFADRDPDEGRGVVR